MKTIKVKNYAEIPKGFTGIVEFLDGDKWWYKNGNLHREDGPAIEWIDGSKFWYKNDKLHREDGPALEYSDGKKCWYKEGERHREDGPAVEWTDGTKEWWLKDKQYFRITINDYVILDHYQGKYGIMWYQLLDENEIFEFPGIPGLILYQCSCCRAH